MTHSDNDKIRIACWGFCNLVRLIFGMDRLNDLPKLIKGRRALLVTTPGFTRRGVTDRIRRLVGSSLVRIVDTVGPNPELDDLEQTARGLQAIRAEVIVAVGGGSVIDTAKAISAVISTTGEGSEAFSLRKHLETDGGKFDGPAVPVIAVPTTAGTGSEVTPFATVWDSVAVHKYSLTGPQLFPEVALLDPSLTVSLPREITIATGLDAISHALEAIWNRNATPITSLYATEALRIAMPVLEQVTGDLDNVYLRAEMLRASMLAGLAISNTRTALAHSMSYPLTMHYGVPHGLACSFTLPSILRFNAEVDDGRLHKLALDLGLKSVNELHEHITRLLDGLGAQKMLAEYVHPAEDLEELAQEMLAPGRLNNNMRPTDRRDVMRILRELSVVGSSPVDCAIGNLRKGYQHH